MKTRGSDFAGGGMDHVTALDAANQALSGRSSRATNPFASVELRGVDELGRTRRESRIPEDGASLPSGAWELAEAHWHSLFTDEGAHFDREVILDAAE